jgi:choline-glycine betaine transporter
MFTATQNYVANKAGWFSSKRQCFSIFMIYPASSKFGHLRMEDKMRNPNLKPFPGSAMLFSGMGIDCCFGVFQNQFIIFCPPMAEGGN